jgi:hypothetical protein
MSWTCGSNRFDLRELFPEAGPLSRGGAFFAEPLDRVAAGNTMARKERFDETIAY